MVGESYGSGISCPDVNKINMCTKEVTGQKVRCRCRHVPKSEGEDGTDQCWSHFQVWDDLGEVKCLWTSLLFLQKWASMQVWLTKYLLLHVTRASEVE